MNNNQKCSNCGKENKVNDSEYFSREGGHICWYCNRPLSICRGFL